MERRLKIAGAVVLYDPRPGFVDAILRYLDDIDRLYVVDNSEQQFDAHAVMLSPFPKVVFIANKDNLGIARALNVAAEHAIRDGYDFLLTMDQDSEAAPGMIQTMLGCLESGDTSAAGMLCPVQVYTSYQRKPQDRPCEEILTAMTSGSILNLKAYRSAGPFLDKLFIDYVDHEYCMRLHLHGFKVIRANNAVLMHKLGTTTEHRFFFTKFALGNHPALRRYYVMRNKFYLRHHYKKHFPEYFRPFFKYLVYEFFTVLLYENDKLNKLRMILRGYSDYRKGRFGKYRDA